MVAGLAIFLQGHPELHSVLMFVNVSSLYALQPDSMSNDT